MARCAQSLQSCPPLCGPVNHGPPGSSVHGILQARVLEWVAISSSSDRVWSEWSEVAQSCPTLCDPMGCSLPGSSVHGIFQARVLEWVAISFSRESSRPREWTRVSRIAGRCFTIWATREAQGQKASSKHVWEGGSFNFSPGKSVKRGRRWFLQIVKQSRILCVQISYRCVFFTQ